MAPKLLTPKQRMARMRRSFAKDYSILVEDYDYFIRASNQPRDPLDPTPNGCWKGGMFYYNPNDAVLFVQRRDGFGYTVNFANRLSWALLGSLVVVFGSAPLILS